MSSQTVYSSGIYHSIPTFPSHENKQYTAIVTGANGITGHHMVRVLSSSPQRWKTIYALSRRPPTHPESRLGEATVKHIAVDFLTQTPEKIAAILRENGVSADYVFFASYVQVPPKEGGGR
jgi:nucleoside-diphosphate-sugar epimerase